MNRLLLAICDTEKEYCRRLDEYLRDHLNKKVFICLNKNQIRSFTKNIDVPYIITDLNNGDNFKEHIEDVGDMLRSNWVIIEDQNIMNDGLVKPYTAAAPTNAHYIQHNMLTSISNFVFKYKNMYL